MRHKRISIVRGAFFLLVGASIGIAARNGIEHIQYRGMMPKSVEAIADFMPTPPGPRDASVAMTTSGPFRYQFTPGETRTYRLSAVSSGLGTDDLESSPIAMQFDSDLLMETKSVDRRGRAHLESSFHNTRMDGGFMGLAVDMKHNPGEGSFSMGGREEVAAGDSMDGVPQFMFFEEPIQMTVGPDGSVEEISGPDGIEMLLSPTDMMAPAEFPSDRLHPGETWTTEFDLPVPGFEIGAPATANSTFLGYEFVEGRQMAVIDQIITSSQEGGKMLSPESVMGESMGFSMPKFLLEGTNRIYFDIERGELAYTEMRLRFELELGDELKPAQQLLSAYESLLDEIEGNGRAPRDLVGNDEDLLDFGVDIHATMTLVN